jgi:hypothetical protein
MSAPPNLCEIPSAVSPDDVYNFDNPVTLKPNLIAASRIMTAIATIFLPGRLVHNIRNFGWSDGQ